MSSQIHQDTIQRLIDNKWKTKGFMKAIDRLLGDKTHIRIVPDAHRIVSIEDKHFITMLEVDCTSPISEDRMKKYYEFASEIDMISNNTFLELRIYNVAQGKMVTINDDELLKAGLAAYYERLSRLLPRKLLERT